MVKEDEKLIIEDGVTVLEPLSFVDCKAKEIIMPDSVETIKHCAFKNCDNLKKIVFGKGIKVIDRDAFHGCHTVNEIVFPEDAVLVQEVKAYENVDAYRKRKKCDESIIDSVENLVSSIFNTTTYAGLPSEEDTRKLVHHFLETGDVACTVKITIGERAVVRQKYINHLDLPSMVSIVRGWMAGWQLITTMSSNLYYSLGIVIESFLTTRSEENTSDRLCLSNLNIFDTVSNIFGSEATAKLIAEDVFCDKQMQDALQFFVENRMTIEASALLQKMKEKGIKPYDENYKL